jgi:DNA primase
VSPKRVEEVRDAKMNGHGQQIVAPYYLRPLPEAAVATPLRVASEQTTTQAAQSCWKLCD